MRAINHSVFAFLFFFRPAQSAGRKKICTVKINAPAKNFVYSPCARGMLFVKLHKGPSVFSHIIGVYAFLLRIVQGKWGLLFVKLHEGPSVFLHIIGIYAYSLAHSAREVGF